MSESGGGKKLREKLREEVSRLLRGGWEGLEEGGWRWWWWGAVCAGWFGGGKCARFTICFDAKKKKEEAF